MDAIHLFYVGESMRVNVIAHFIFSIRWFVDSIRWIGLLISGIEIGIGQRGDLGWIFGNRRAFFADAKSFYGDARWLETVARWLYVDARTLYGLARFLETVARWLYAVAR